MEEQKPSRKPHLQQRGLRMKESRILTQKCLIKELEKGSTILGATQKCKCSEGTYYKWKKYDDDFRQKLDDLFNLQLEIAEDILKKSIEDNPNLLMFFLKHRHPEYRVRQSIELNHKGLESIEVKVILPEGYKDPEKH